MKGDPECARLTADQLADWEKNDWAFHWWREQAYEIWLPGATEADRRISWSTADPRHKINALEILNELGAQGWELVTSAASYTAIDSGVFGWDTVGTPVQVTLTLKRPMTG
jgi:hypothetical protein